MRACHPQQAQSEAILKQDRHQRVHNDKDKFGKIKFTMPKFKGEENSEAYIDWELKVEKIFRIHNFSEEKKVAMASLEFEDYANIWWEEQQAHRELHRQGPISTWDEMKYEMYARFVQEHYCQDLFNKLQQLKKGTKSAEEYYKEMEMTVLRVDLKELEEQTMARFLSGLNYPIRKIVDFQPYKNMTELLYQDTKVERHIRADFAYERNKA